MIDTVDMAWYKRSFENVFKYFYPMTVATAAKSYSCESPVEQMTVPTISDGGAHLGQKYQPINTPQYTTITFFRSESRTDQNDRL